MKPSRNNLRTQSRLAPLIVLIWLALTFTASAQSTPTQKEASMPNESLSYPRIEVYSEIDKGDPNAGSQTWTDPSGRTVHGGRQDYRPYIQRTTYLVAESDKSKLLATVLRFQPYFGEQKPEITLGDYFQAAANPDRMAAFNLLPTNLNFLQQQKAANEDYPFFSTLVIYQDRHPGGITVVWLDPNTWYVNDVYYTDWSGLDDFAKDGQQDIVAEGSFAEFLRYSPIFQSKLAEGFSNLEFRVEQPAIPMNKVVLVSSLSPGSPGTVSFHREVAGDGSIMRGMNKTAEKVDLNGLTALLLQADRLNWDNFGLGGLKPFVHDGRTASIAFWSKGSLKTIELDDPAMTAMHKDFVDNVNQFLAVGRDGRDTLSPRIR